MFFSAGSSALRTIVSLLVVGVLFEAPLITLAKPPADAASLTNEQRAQQVLSRLTFGARPGDVDKISQTGVDAFIDQQLDPDSIDDSAMQKRLDRLPTLNLSTPALAEQYNPPKPTPTPTPSVTPTPIPAPPMNAVSDASGQMMLSPSPSASVSPTPKPTPTPALKNPGMVVNELQRAKVLRAVYSERQLYEVMVDFWENHFSIFANKDADRWMLTEFDRDVITPWALGSFRDLLGATAHSPAMLYYLDNWQSSVVKEYPATKDKPARRTGGINENYARELMELHTLGVDGGYTQKDVQEVARCFTGWTIRKPNEEGLFVYNPAAHDQGEKTVLGVKIPAGGGIRDGERVLDILASSPATARFISTKLARHFIGDDPPGALIDRTAKVFLNSNGSIPETLKSLITSKEFTAAGTFQSKVKSPFQYVVSALRATNAETDGTAILDWIKRMGEPVFGRVTPDGYPDKADGWLSSNDLLTRFNFASALAFGQIRGTSIKLEKLVNISASPPQLVASVISAILSGYPSDRTRASLMKAATAEQPAQPQMLNTSAPSQGLALPGAQQPKPADPQRIVAQQALALALGSPEFQHR
ncbi:MAG: DUF1800 domain-containing protein [Acidobacteria bacterium]|nr:DUF1800 domain-containing protein [Acidobacteriota bacterium]